MTDVVLKPLYASVVEDEGTLFIGFAEGEDDAEPYVLLRQEGDGPIWFEVSDESLGAEDAIEEVRRDEKGLTFVIAEHAVPKIGGAKEIAVRITLMVEDAEIAVDALKEIFGARFKG